ncbi:uncharacterized protein CC84DRAFT_420401 [Paraphaeosphaeria sporulosa]|uniref:Mid2 domain-containing protein n=1 Tax=Paraphaeosphaeria sporulosa TaxID=1460663 RepID=A0A177BWJ0_9PLEO|nr:uncharacterized protein CC84DRAFT_420401 [Paraphaeosphaeria sporulosa]OAF98689.1 hypothetical protein CC84DRAFT_420401 [Paraphaeosphaeria sporulosa]
MVPACSSAAFLAFVHLIVGVIGESCYYPDGSTDSGHFACSTGGTSVCCAEGFECLSNGLCNDYRYENYTRVLRGGCTDKDWGEGCPQTCTSLWPQGDEIVYVCSNDKFCCGRSEACCDDNNAKFFDFGNPQIIATAGKTQATSTPQGGNEQATASSQPTKVGEQNVPSQTQSQQQDDAASATKASSTGSLEAPSETPANTRTDTSGDNTAKAEATQESESNTTGAPGRTNTGSSVAGSGSGSAATDTADKHAATPPSDTNHTVAIAAGVGVGVGVLAFLLAVAGCWHIRRKRQRPGLRSRNVLEIGESSTPAIEVADSNFGVVEKGTGNNRVFELDGHAMEVELPVGHEAEEVHGESAEGKKWPDMFR